MSDKTDDVYELRARRFGFLIVVALVFLLYAAFSQLAAWRQAEQIEQQKQPDQGQTLPEKTSSAIEALGRLAVRGRVSSDGYSRSKFGEGWQDVMGCDVRNRILRQSLKQIRLDEDGCKVLSGVLQQDPYTGNTIQFQRGQDTSDDIQIDHVVALSDSWAKGAQNLSEIERVQFANDPLNLLAVDGPANMEKGNQDASEWLPRKEFRCRYVARQVAVKIKYELWVTRSEHNAMKKTLGLCPRQILPTK